HAGDRRGDDVQQVLVCARRHAREQGGRELPERIDSSRSGVAHRARGDSARSRPRCEHPRSGDRQTLRSDADEVGLMSGAVPEISLRPGGRLRRRRIVNRLMESLGTLAALLAVGVLVIVVVSVVRKGAPALSWHFLVSKPNLFGGPGGGIASAIVGTVIIVGLAAAIALPVGVLTAVYLTEFAPRRVAG